MLVLSRHRGQGVEFPECGVSISVLETTSNRVRIGVDAPKDITILRSELSQSLAGTKVAAEKNSTGNTSGVESRLAAVVDSPLQQRRYLEQARRAVSEIAANYLDVSDENVRRLLSRFQGNVDVLQAAMLAGVERRLSGAVESEGRSQGRASKDVGSYGKGDSRLASAKLSQVSRGSRKSLVSSASDVAAPRRALLVDDNVNESKLLAGFLRLRDYEVQIASDGLSAINYLVGNKAPDVVLLDMAMPNMDGATTIRAIRNEPCFQSLPVIAVSGGTAQDYGVSLGAGGVNDWFQKPLDPEALVQNIEQVVNAAICTEETEARRSSSAKERLTGCGSSGVR